MNGPMEYEYYNVNVVLTNLGQWMVSFASLRRFPLLFKVKGGVARDMFGKKGVASQLGDRRVIAFTGWHIDCKYAAMRFALTTHIYT